MEKKLIEIHLGGEVNDKTIDHCEKLMNVLYKFKLLTDKYDFLVLPGNGAFTTTTIKENLHY